MRIFRDGKEIELTEREVQEAYREQLENYRFMDAQAQLEYYIGPNSKGHLNKSGFYLRYGFRFDEAVDPESEHYLLGEIVRQFEQCADCNIAENDMYESIIGFILETHKIPRPKVPSLVPAV